MKTWTTLAELREGALFVTRKGVRAVKTEYRYPNGGIECVLEASGEYAHFAQDIREPTARTRAHNATEVREVPWPEDAPSPVAQPGGSERVSDAEIAEALRLHTDHVKNGELFKAHNGVVQIVAERALHLANKAAREVATLREAARNLLAEREQAEDARALYDAIGDFCEKVGVKP